MLTFLLLVPILFSHSMCLDVIHLSLGNSVVTFWKRAAHSVYRMFYLYFDLL